MTITDLAERSLIPDTLIRYGMRRLMQKRLDTHYSSDIEAQTKAYRDLLATLRESPVAINTNAANQQHYEVPAAFYELVLGARKKYSCAYWTPDCNSLDQAELAMLDIYSQRAELKNGQQILELGCGWGSLTLWIAENHPESHVTGVSNSSSQREYILSQARERGLNNLDIITADVNFFQPPETDYDRIVSIEMFEHMRNYQTLMERIATWLCPGGKLFVHIFCHHRLMYPFVTEGTGSDAGDWMGRYFFTGGLMPSVDTLLHFQQDLELEDFWLVDGRHYEKTANAWLDNLDQRSKDVLRVCETIYGAAESKRWRQRWRLFFMACAELFGFNNGREWPIAHYRFTRRQV